MQSPVTREFCNNQVKIMTEKIDNLKDKFTSFELNITKQIAELPNALEEKFDERYANKRIEKGFDKLIWIVIAGVAIGVLNLIIK